MEYRDALKMMRGELGVSQTELANILHISVSTVSRWELGRTRPNRPIAELIFDYASAHGVSAACLDALKQSYTTAVKKKLNVSQKNIYTVEHSSLRQLIDDASFPIYVCDIETDELLYLNQKACAMVCTEESAIGKKCYKCLMHRDVPCESCHKNELVEDKFKSYDAYRPFDGVIYHVQGKLIHWNGRRAQVRYVLGQGSAPEQQLTDAQRLEASIDDEPMQADAAETEKLVLRSIEDERSTEQLKAIFENINGGVSVVVYADDGLVRLAYANDRYYELFGYTKRQFAMELNDPHSTIYPDDCEYVTATIAKVRETRQATTFRYRIVKRDKSIAHIRCNSSVSSIEGLGDKVMISVLTDVTASVQTEQQALVSGQRLDAIMKNMTSAVTATMVKNDGTVEYLFTNDHFHEILGYTKEQYQTEVSDPFLLIHPDDAPALQSAVLELNQNGGAKDLKYRVITRAGKVKWINARISMMSFPDADAPVQLAVYTDVTDMVEATEKLAEQKDKITEVLNETPSGIAVVEVDRSDVAGTLRTIYYNDRFFSFSGYNRDEYGAMLKKNEMAFVFDEDVPTLLADTKKICDGEIGASADSTVRCHTKDGGFRWLLLTGQLTERRGNTCIVNIALVDVTERKCAIDRQRISEEMLRIAAETDNRAMIVYDVKSNSCRAESRMLFSAKYGETFYNIPQSLIDQGIVSPESVDELCALFARIRNGEKEIKVSLQMHTGADKFDWFECNAATVLDADGQPDHAVLVFHNITEQRVKEAVFKKWQQSIDARPSESYTLFRCNLSKDASLDEHDGSLLKVNFSAQTLSFNERTKLYVDEYVYPDDRDAYSALLNSDTLLAMFYRGEHSAELDYREIDKDGETLWRRLTVEMVEYPYSTDIQAFLMYEDIDEAKKAEIEAREIAETDPLTGALNRAAFAEKVDAIIHDEPTSHNALIMLDMDGFKQLNDSFGHAAGDQALQDVVAVLRSYTRNGDLVCRLGGDEFLVWLRDIPYDAVIAKIAQQMCEHIRKAYSQEVLLSASVGIAAYPRDGQSYDELYPNADKALYKVKQAEKGTYAFFSVTDEVQTPEVTEALSAVRQTSQSPHGAKRRILIVDDSEANRMMLKNIFKNDYLIETAKNGAEAMIRLRHFGVSISAVLLDLMMPGVDGYSVLNKMQSNTEMRTIPVIVVTGDEERDTLLKVIELGAAEYVTKPVDVDIIRMRVQSVISKAENERLRAQNSYLLLQRDEEVKYRTVLDSTGTVVVEYDWRNHVFIYGNEISKYIAGNFDHRGLWQVLLSDMVADSADVKTMQDMLISLANRGPKQDSKLIKLKTPKGEKHWFRMNVYKREDEFGLAEKMILTFNDVHEKVMANDKLMFQATRDQLTGLYNRAGFIEKAAELIAAREPGYYVMACIDIERFKVINDQYGTDKGDEVLIKFARALEKLHSGQNGICCRLMADNFAVLYPARLLDSPELESSHLAMEHIDDTIPAIRFAAGRCLVDDKTLDVTAIYDRAVIAKDTVKGRYDKHIATFDESMRTAILRQQEITGQMNHALESGQFEVWLQPQFNHTTGMLSGAEALVRWRHPTEGIISPEEFIPIFERNGFVYEVDKYVWEQTCILLRKWLDQGLNPVPVSVNISRYDVFRDDLISVIEGLVKKYDLPLALLRLEITESAFSESANQIIKVVEALVAAGFTVEIDDFGSGYSSLNTLKDVPAQILKMDMRFLENDKNTQNAQRGGSIIESVVRMAKWLGMSVIAEGVETIEQADYLTSIGCKYIQGYLYSRPRQVVEYEKLFADGKIEPQLGKLKTVDTWNNTAFWNPTSMETLIFNSYVGGACIFEYNKGKTELLRYNAEYAELFGMHFKYDTPDTHNDILSVLDDKNAALFRGCIDSAIATKKEASCEIKLLGSNHEIYMYFNATMRQIAEAGERQLFYCVVSDNTDRRVAEMKALEASERVNAVMNYSHCGISAVIAHPDGKVDYLFVNNRFYELLGYTKEQYEAEVKSPFDCVYPEDRDRIFDAVTKLSKIGDTASLRLRDMRRDGTVIWLRCDISIVRFANISQPVQMASFLDITEQVESEMKQLESARQLEVIMSNVNGGVSAVQIHDDGSSSFVFNNDKYYELYGYTTEQARAEHLDVMSLVLPEDMADVMAKVKKLKKDKQSTYIDYRIQKPDGSRALLRANASLMSIPGYGDDIITSVIVDITEKKSLEDQLSAIVSNINGGITATIIRDGKPEFVIVNDRFYQMLGYANSEEYELACGGDKYKHVHPDDRKRIVAQFESSDGGKTRYTMEYRALHKDGSIRYIRNNISVVRLFGYSEPIQLSVANDVTDTVEAQRREQRIARQMTTIMEKANGGITATVYHDHNNVEVLFSNDAFYEMYGYTKAQLEAEVPNMLDLIFDEDREKTMNTVARIVREHGSETYEYRCHTRNGGMVWIQACNSVVSIEDVGNTVLLAITTDITALRLAQQQSAAAMSKLETVMDNMANGMTAVALHGNRTEFLFANAKYYEMHGVTKESYESGYLKDALQLVYPDDRALVRETVLKATEIGEHAEAEYRVLHPDGTVRWAKAVINVTNIAGVDVPVQVTLFRDITEERENQHKILQTSDILKSIMANAGNGITAVALDGDKREFMFANDKYFEILGYSREDYVKKAAGDRFAMVHPEDKEKLSQKVFEINTYKKTGEVEFRAVREDGKIIWVKAAISVTNMHGINKPVQICAFSDITAEKKANEQLRFLNDAAQEILAQPDSEKAINDALKSILDYFGGERSYIMEINYANNTTSNTYEVCAEGIESRKAKLQNVPTGISGYEPGHLIQIDDVSALDESHAKAKKLLDEYGIHAAFVVSLKCEGRVIGCLEVDNPTTALDQVEQLKALADYFAVLLTRRDLVRKIQQDSTAMKLLIDDTPGGFCRMEIHAGKNPTLVTVNTGFCHMLGMTEAEVYAAYGDDMYKCLTTEDIATATDDSADAHFDGGQFSTRCRLKCKDGSQLWVRIFGRFVNTDGGKTYLNSYFTDISQQKRAEEQQIELLDNLPSGAALYEYDGEKLTAIHINKRYWQLVEREPVAYGKASVIGAIHPEDKLMVVKELEAAIRQSRDVDVSFRIRCGEHGYKPFHITASITPQEKGKYIIYASYTPISEHAMSIQEMIPIAISVMMATSDDISYVKGSDLRYVCCSQALSDMAGVESTRDLVGKSVYELFSKDLADKFNAADKEVITTGKPALNLLEHLPVADGSTRLVRTSKYPMMDANGGVIGVYCVSRDVTALKQKESQLNLLTNSIPGGLAAYSISKDGIKTLYFNDGYYAYSGYTREEYIKLTEKEPLALMFEEDRPKMLEMIRDFATQKNDGMTGEYVYRCRTKDGGLRWMSLKAVLTIVGEEQYTLNVVQLDVTEQMEEENRRNALLDNLPFGAAMYEFDGKGLKAVHINKQYGIMVNRSVNSTLEGFKPVDFIHPDDRKMVVDEVQDAIADQRDGYCNVRLLYGDNEYRTFHLDARIMPNGDGKYLLYVIYSCISEQELTFKNALPFIFSTIMESSTDLAFAKDINFRYICCSTSFASLIGLKSPNEVVGKTDYELFSRKIADQFHREDSELFATEKPQIDVTEALPAADGKLHYTRTSKHLLRNTIGEVIGVYCVGRDVTKTREAYAQLKLLNDSVPGGIVTFNCSPQGIKTAYYNEGLCKLSGYTKADHEAGNVNPIELVFKEDRRIFDAQLDVMLRNGIPMDCVFRIHTKSGGYKWVSGKAVVSDHVNDTFVVNAVLMDITEQQEEKERLRLAEEEYRIATQHSGHTIGRYDIAAQTLTITEDAAVKLALPECIPNVPYGRVKLGKISSDTAEAYIAFYEKIKSGEKECSVTFQKLLTTGWRWIAERATTIFDDEGKPVSAIISYVDVTEQQEKEAVYKKWKQSLQDKDSETYTLYRVNLNKPGVLDTGEGSLLEFVPSDVECKAGVNETAEYFAQRYVYEEDRKVYTDFLNADAMLAGYYRGMRSASLDFRCLVPGKATRWFRLSVELVEYPNSTDVQAYLLYEDINDSKVAELVTKTQAQTDPLTGVLNRAAFVEQVNEIMRKSHAGEKHALFMLDVDEFKHVNDKLGHGNGDSVLVDITKSIRSVLRGCDLLGRLGGDEFVVFLRDMPDNKVVADKAQQICAKIFKPINDDVLISSSIGIAIYPSDGKDFETLYGKADKALYRVKENGKDNFAFYREIN